MRFVLLCSKVVLAELRLIKRTVCSPAFHWVLHSDKWLQPLGTSCRPLGGRESRTNESETTGARVTPASYRVLHMDQGSEAVVAVLQSVGNHPGGLSQTCKTTGSCHTRHFAFLISSDFCAFCPALLCITHR